MTRANGFVDIHCHLLPGLDDGAEDCQASLAMARQAVADGIATIVATPHQLGNYPHNDAATIRAAVDRLRDLLAKEQIPLAVLPGGDVRIESDLVGRVRRGEVLTLADRGRHVLLELPHELYLPLDRLLQELRAAGLVGILSHPERNAGILARPEVLPPLVARGCLMQVTAASVTGVFGTQVRTAALAWVKRGLVHFVSTDAHGPKVRPAILSQAYAQIASIAGTEMALDLCCRHPARVVSGQDVQESASRKAVVGGWRSWFRRREAG